jgi:hypothetical protein
MSRQKPHDFCQTDAHPIHRYDEDAKRIAAIPIAPRNLSQDKEAVNPARDL